MRSTGAVSVSRKHGCFWITMPDSITVDNYVLVEEEIVTAVAEHSTTVVLDLAATRNLFSSGLGLLIRTKKRLDEKNCRLYLVNVSHRIRDILAAVHLDGVFAVYATDVEFEISQTDILEKTATGNETGFIFSARVEKGVGRIRMSGACGMGKDLSPLETFTPDPAIRAHVFDLTGLDVLDTPGIHLVSRLFVCIRDNGGTVITYGGNDYVKELMDLLNLSDFVKAFADERAALDAAGAVT